MAKVTNPNLNTSVMKNFIGKAGYRTYIGVGLGSLSQVITWLTTEQKDLCLPPRSKVGSSLILSFSFVLNGNNPGLDKKIYILA